MAANTAPIFSKNGAIGSVLVTAANTSSQGGGTIGTDIFKAFTADATNGSYIVKARWIPTATAPTNTTGTVGRIFASSITSGPTTSADTFLLAETTLPIVAADNSGTAVLYFDIDLRVAINAGYTILGTNHGAPAANTAWRLIIFAGDY